MADALSRLESGRFGVCARCDEPVPVARLRPVTVVLFRNDRTMEPYLPLENGRPAKLGGFFVSFMSGNSTRLAVGLAGIPAEALIAGRLIGCFVLGVIAGSLIGAAARRMRRPVVLLLVALLVAVGAMLAGTSEDLAVLFVAAAMGAENTTFERDGEVWLVRRQDKGMLGGMRALPDDSWNARADGNGEPPLAGEWQAAGQVEHTFTHFHLTLSLRLYSGGIHARTANDDGEWWPVTRLDEAGLPTLFAKAARLALALRGDD